MNLILPALGGGYLCVISPCDCSCRVVDSSNPSHTATMRAFDCVEIVRTMPPIPMTDEERRDLEAWLAEHPL